jgi:hypothetical protein
MIGTTKTLVLRTVLCAVLIFGIAASPVSAQSFLSSMESVFGPIVPNCGIASTFRSELGTGLSMMRLEKAQLSGGDLATPFGVGQVSLENWANLNKSPLRLDLYANLRLWRVGARGQWTQFEDRSQSPDLGKFSFSTIKLGADFDAIQHCWLVVGASADFYLSNPEFHGTLRRRATERLSIDFTGKKPVTIGAYARYIPPEILNIPVHAEFYANFPLLGSSLTQYGGALVFRPQIYRFDAAIKILLERSYLKVLDASDAPNPYTLDTEWFRYGLELAVYF